LVWLAIEVFPAAGEHRHSTIDQALRLPGFGTNSLRPVASDRMGRMTVGGLRGALASCTGPTIVSVQAGEVDTGSFDPIADIAAVVEETDAWLHADGAFGLWARASARFATLAEGVDRADSWAFDVHKWLNVPYDCGVAVVADPEAHGASRSMPPFAHWDAAASPSWSNDAVTSRTGSPVRWRAFLVQSWWPTR
jgi:glutamate/tyrosine decarboxylase-like PLP-dependent enzyme